MKAYYFENNGYNGILMECNNKAIIYADEIDGIEINIKNTTQIVENWKDYGLDDLDFWTTYETKFDSLMYSEDAKKSLDEQDYYELIYEN